MPAAATVRLVSLDPFAIRSMGLTQPIRRRAAKFFREREDEIFFAFCGFIGVLASLVAAGFRIGTDWLRSHLVGPQTNVLDAMAALDPLQRVLIPAAGGLVVGLILLVLRQDDGSGHGVPEVMEIFVLGKRSLRLLSVLKKSFASMVGIVTGSSVGREGPIIQLASAIAARAGIRARLSDESYRILTAAGVAAGVAAAYHTPLAGTLFVAEIIVGTLNVRVLGAAVVAAVSASVTSDAILGMEPPLYALPPFHVASVAEYGAYVVLGGLAGVVGVAFLATIRGGSWVFARVRLPIPVRTALGGAIVGAIGLRFPEVYGNGYEATRAMLQDAFPLGVLVALGVLKMIATGTSVSSGVPGGIFTPTLFGGAALGAAFGHVVAKYVPIASTQVPSYALLGMAGALAATMHAPLLSTVMIIELTNNYSMALPLLVVSFVGRTVAKGLHKSSVYTEVLEKKGLPTEGSMESRMMGSLKVKDLVRTDVELLPQATPLTEIVRRFSESRALYLYVGDDDRRLVGAIDLHDLKGALGEHDISAVIIARDLAKPVPVGYPHESITEVNHRLWLQDVGHLPIVKSEEDHTWLGVLTRRDVLGAVDREILKRNLMMAPIRAAGAEETDWFELPPGGRLEAIRVPADLIGKTIAEAGLGQRLGVTILAIRRRGKNGEESRYLPRPDIRLEGADLIVVLGPNDVVGALLEGKTPDGLG